MVRQSKIEKGLADFYYVKATSFGREKPKWVLDKSKRSGMLSGDLAIDIPNNFRVVKAYMHKQSMPYAKNMYYISIKATKKVV